MLIRLAHFDQLRFIFWSWIKFALITSTILNFFKVSEEMVDSEDVSLHIDKKSFVVLLKSLTILLFNIANILICKGVSSPILYPTTT